MKKIIIYTDGGSRGNPGKAALGVVFCNEKDSWEWHDKMLEISEEETFFSVLPQKFH